MDRSLKFTIAAIVAIVIAHVATIHAAEPPSWSAAELSTSQRCNADANCVLAEMTAANALSTLRPSSDTVQGCAVLYYITHKNVVGVDLYRFTLACVRSSQ